jgi:hypothetical protein
VWYWDPGYIALAHNIGATGLLIKAADGTSAWSQWGAAAQTARAAGLEAMPWSYNYGDAGEVETLLATGESTLMLDIEAHFESQAPSTQQAFIERVRQARAAGRHFLSCVEARPEVHGGIPYDDIAGVSDGLVPMVAWQVWLPRDYAAWLTHWDAYGYRGFPWLPAGDVTPSELVASVAEAQRRYGAASIWEAGILTVGQVEALHDAAGQS